MNLTKNDIQSFAMAVFNTHDLSTIKIDKDSALSFLENEIQSDYEELNLIETMQARHRYFKIGDIDDYAEHFIEIENGKNIICGIRHLGGNPDLPFISCISNFEIGSRKNAELLATRIMSRFEKFKPLYLGFWSSRNIEIDFKGSVYLASQIREMDEPQNWKLDDRISLEPITDNSYYDWYKSGYEHFHLERPELRSKVTLNSLDVMGESLDQGLLFFAKINHVKVGLIAAIKSDLLGHAGIYFNEIFISKEFRRKGLAKSIQRKFILDNAKSEDIIWGTIDYENKSSYQTAVSNKRTPIRYECFLSLA